MQESVIVRVQTGYSLGVVGGGVMLPPTTVGLAAVPSGAAGFLGAFGSAGTIPVPSGGTGAGGTLALGSAAGGVAGGTVPGGVVVDGGVVGGGAVSGVVGIDVGGVVSGVCAGTCATAGKPAPARSMAGSINRVFIFTSPSNIPPPGCSDT